MGEMSKTKEDIGWYLYHHFRKCLSCRLTIRNNSGSSGIVWANRFSCRIALRLFESYDKELETLEIKL
jgi:hypothetical protein